MIMSKLSDLLIEQIEQGQNALKKERNDLINEKAVEHGLHADDDRDEILWIIEESNNE
jgi:hypothetical protein|tara:strand:- start:27 stop:200 length:174 start_codon:yes stop_codon:yes gene_type:complete